MNDLRLGHQVLAWDDDDEKEDAAKGRYICDDDTQHMPHKVLLDGYVEIYKNCEIDPDADRFLPGDEVEVSANGKDWIKTRYCGELVDMGRHLAECNYEKAYEYCRYPKPEPVFRKLESTDTETTIEFTDFDSYPDEFHLNDEPYIRKSNLAGLTINEIMEMLK